MTDYVETVRRQVARQVAHWAMAARRLEHLDAFASPAAMAELERYMGAVIRRNLAEAVDRLQRQAAILQAELNAAETLEDLNHVRLKLGAFRRHYFRTETTLDFYADAINTRTDSDLSALLRACDILARRSMSEILDQLQKITPPVLTYVDKGLGASILRAGLRLWDGRTESAVAAIKVVRHNLYRPTSLVHEAGHQIAHILGWNEELATALRRSLADAADAAILWATWASEVAADAVAFAHTGYASVAALHDVLAGDEQDVFRFIPLDPHPVTYVRVLLGTEMCSRFYGAGPWDDLARTWIRDYPLDSAPGDLPSQLRSSLPLLPKIVEITLRTPMRAFGGKPLAALADPGRVRPDVLQQLEAQAGPALFTSHHWVWHESLRLLALTGLRAAVAQEQALDMLAQQEGWMRRLGNLQPAA